MNARTFEVDVHREPPGYWAEVGGLEGCYASGQTLDELFQALREAISMYLGEVDDERILVRVTGLRLAVQPDLRPADAKASVQPPSRRKRQSHRHDWPPDERSR
jgi:predicted RNase H-like HicB family nuclease